MVPVRPKATWIPKLSSCPMPTKSCSVSIGTQLIFSRRKDKHGKNSAGDTDVEMFSFRRYLGLLLEGQTNALDMIFAPSEFYLMEPDPAWLYVLKNRDKFVHAGSSAFAGYCKTQANKYCLKGNRLATARGALELVDKMISKTDLYCRLLEHEAHINEYNEGKEFANVVECKGPHEGTFVKHWEVCNRKIPFHATLKYVHERLSAVINEYGDRAKKAEVAAGSDWKALSHAVRVCEEAKELMSTGKITFPRPEADLLLKIKTGEMPYDTVSDMIEKGLIELEALTANSTLRKHPDHEFAKKTIKAVHAKVVHDSIDTNSWKDIYG